MQLTKKSTKLRKLTSALFIAMSLALGCGGDDKNCYDRCQEKLDACLENATTWQQRINCKSAYMGCYDDCNRSIGTLVSIILPPLSDTDEASALAGATALEDCPCEQRTAGTDKSP